MNKAIKIAKGEYCLFLNSGDWLFYPQVLEEAFNNNFHEDFVYGYQLIEENENFTEEPCLDVNYLTFRTLSVSHIPHQACFIKRELFEKVGLYNEENRIVSDWEFIMLSLFHHNCSIRRIDTKITVYDTNGISSVRDFKLLQDEERKKSLRKNFPLIYPDYEYFEAFLQKPYIKSILWFRNFIKKVLKK